MIIGKLKSIVKAKEPKGLTPNAARKWEMSLFLGNIKTAKIGDTVGILIPKNSKLIKSCLQCNFFNKEKRFCSKKPRNFLRCLYVNFKGCGLGEWQK